MNNESFYAGFWIRFLATLIDGIVFSIIGLLFYYLFWKSIPWTSVPSIIEALMLGIQGLILFLLIHFFYDILLNVNLGGTLGKQAVGLEVRSEQNVDERISYGHAVGRYFIKNFVSGTFFMLGFLWAAFDERKQTWHDRLAKTIVIVKAQYERGAAAPFAVSPEPLKAPKSLGKKIGALVINAGIGKGRSFDVRAPKTVIGSDSDCDIVLDNDYHYVSRHHCEVFSRDGAVFLRHLSTTNPTYVNARKVAETRLRDNDTVTVCDFTLKLKLF